MSSWIGIAAGCFFLGLVVGVALISIFASKNVGRLEDVRVENALLRQSIVQLRRALSVSKEIA